MATDGVTLGAMPEADGPEEAAPAAAAADSEPDPERELQELQKKVGGAGPGWQGGCNGHHGAGCLGRRVVRGMVSRRV